MTISTELITDNGELFESNCLTTLKILLFRELIEKQ